jgi:hypothetical protein
VPADARRGELFLLQPGEVLAEVSDRQIRNRSIPQPLLQTTQIAGVRRQAIGSEMTLRPQIVETKQHPARRLPTRRRRGLHDLEYFAGRHVCQNSHEFCYGVERLARVHLLIGLSGP